MFAVTSDERQFWNESDMVEYFAEKPADPRIASYLSDAYKSTYGLHALDLGCGGGRHSELLARRGFVLDAVDVNTAMLARSAKRLAESNLKGNIQEASITSLPFEDARFDVVITTGVLHQAKTVADYHVAIKELSRVTKDGGTILLNIFTNDVWDETYTPLDDTHNSVITEQGVRMTLLSKDEFIGAMKTAGFGLVLDYGTDIKQENTGQRAVFRAVFGKA